MQLKIFFYCSPPLDIQPLVSLESLQNSLGYNIYDKGFSERISNSTSA